jgi:hypothetical protein
MVPRNWTFTKAMPEHKKCASRKPEVSGSGEGFLSEQYLNLTSKETRRAFYGRSLDVISLGDNGAQINSMNW